MATLNKTFLMGRLTATPELKSTTSGLSVTTFTIAVDRGYGDKKNTDFINCVAWRKTAEFVSRYFNKGSLIFIEGNIQTRSYEDKNGSKRMITEIVVDEAQFVESKKVETTETNHFEEVNEDEDLPF